MTRLAVAHRALGAARVDLTLGAVGLPQSSPPPYQPPDRATRSPSPRRRRSPTCKWPLEYMRLNNLARARERIERALEEAPENPNVQETAGLVYERLNEMSKAQHAFSAAARLGKQDPGHSEQLRRFPVPYRQGRRRREAVPRGGAKSDLSDAGGGAAQRRSVRRRRGRRRRCGALFQARAHHSPEHARGAAAARQSRVDRGDAAQALDFVQRYLAVNAADSRSALAWATARSASSAIARPPQAMRGGYRPNSRIPNRHKRMRSGVDR